MRAKAGCQRGDPASDANAMAIASVVGSGSCLAENFDDRRRNRSGVLERMFRAALQIQHLPGRHVDRTLALNRQDQLSCDQHEHLIRRIVVRVHAARGARLGVVAQDAELRPIDDSHGREAGIAFNRPRALRAANGLCVRIGDRQREDCENRYQQRS